MPYFFDWCIKVADAFIRRWTVSDTMNRRQLAPVKVLQAFCQVDLLCQLMTNRGLVMK